MKFACKLSTANMAIWVWQHQGEDVLTSCMYKQANYLREQLFSYINARNGVCCCTRYDTMWVTRLSGANSDGSHAVSLLNAACKDADKATMNLGCHKIVGEQLAVHIPPTLLARRGDLHCCCLHNFNKGESPGLDACAQKLGGSGTQQKQL